MKAKAVMYEHFILEVLNHALINDSFRWYCDEDYVILSATHSGWTIGVFLNMDENGKVFLRTKEFGFSPTSESFLRIAGQPMFASLERAVSRLVEAEFNYNRS